MFARPLQMSDAREIVFMGAELYKLSAYWRESKPLDAKLLTETISTCLAAPNIHPAFVLDTGTERLAGMLYLVVSPNYLNGEKWLDEKILYIRPEFRSLRAMRMLIGAMEQWAAENGIDHIEMSNASTKDHRLGQLYGRMGYEVANITYSKRLTHGEEGWRTTLRVDA